MGPDVPTRGRTGFCKAPRRTRRRATKRMAESVARMIPSPMVVIVPSGLSDRFLWDKTGESLRFSREM